MRKINVYVGHKLYDASEMFLTSMDITFATVFSVLTNCIRVPFLGLKWSDPIEVYQADIEKGVAESDLVVLVFDERSDGIIAELCAALWLFGIPVLVVYKRGTKISGLIRGIFRKFPDRIMEREYTTVNDIVFCIQEAISVYKLNTLHPKTFPCIESMRPNPLFCREALVYEGYEHMQPDHTHREHEEETSINPLRRHSNEPG